MLGQVKRLPLSPTKKVEKKLQKREVKHFQETVKKAVFNYLDVADLNIEEFFEYEYLYLRNCELVYFNVGVPFPNLRILDLSCNEIVEQMNCLAKLPNLRHLILSNNQLTSFGDFPTLKKLETLTISNNYIQNFIGLELQPELRALILLNNFISSFEGYPFLPNLQVLDLRNNPICQIPHYRELAIGLHNYQVFEKLDGVDVSVKEREMSKLFMGRVAYCVREGFFADETMESIEMIQEASDAFFTDKSIQKTTHTPLELVSMKVERELIEGTTIRFKPIFKITDSTLHFFSSGFVKKSFECSSPGNDAYLEIQNCKIPMRKNEEKFLLDLLLTRGTYDATLFVDGKETSHEKFELVEKELENLEQRHGQKNLIHVFTAWSRLTTSGELESINEAQDIDHLLNFSDIGRILGIQISAFRQEDHLFTLFDFTNEIQQTDPQCVDLKISGKFIEGETIEAISKYIGGKEGQSRMFWTNEHDQVICEGKSLVLNLEHVDQKLKCHYIPIRQDGIVGREVIFETNTIQWATPELQNLKFGKTLVQDIATDLSFTYFGGIQGESIFNVYRCDNAKGKNGILIQTLKEPKIVPCLDDVNHYLLVECIAVDRRNNHGMPQTIISGKVLPAEPAIHELAILGQCTEGQKLNLECQYYGGFEGASSIEWVLKRSDNSSTIIARSGRDLFLKLEYVNHRILVKYTPTRSDGAVGKSVEVISSTIMPGLPQCRSLLCSGAVIEKQIISMVPVYFGGIEGCSKFAFYRITTEDEVLVHNTSNSYKITLDDVNCKLKLVYSPIREDGVEGTQFMIETDLVEPAPPVVDQIILEHNSTLEGNLVKAVVKSSGGIEKEKKYKWIRKNKNGVEEEIAFESLQEYRLSAADIFCTITCGVKSVRDDGVESDWVFSDPTDEVIPVKPVVYSMFVEGNVRALKTVKVWYSGNEFLADDCKCSWYSTDMSNNRDLLHVGNEYTIPLAAIGLKLLVVLEPYRAGHPEVKNDPYEIITKEVESDDPIAKSVRIDGKFSPNHEIHADAAYEGGIEGTSEYYWYLMGNDDTEEKEIYLPQYDNVRTITIPIEFELKRLKLRYVPVRSDGTKGSSYETVSPQIGPSLPTITQLNIKGNIIEGTVLSIDKKYYGGEEGASLIKWYRVKDGQESEVADTPTYTLTVADLQYKIKISYLPVRADKTIGVPFTTITEQEVVPLGPKCSGLKMFGSPFVSKTISVKYTYIGGLEGPTRIEWFSSLNVSGPYKLLPKHSATYSVNADDFMHYIKVKITPVRSDGVEGKSIETNPVLPIKTSPEVFSVIQEAVKNGKTVLVADEDNEKVMLEVTSSKINFLLQSGKLLYKVDLSKNVKIVLDPNNDKRFTIVSPKFERHYVTENQFSRDVTVLTLRAFIALSDPSTVENIYGKDFKKNWAKQKDVRKSVEGLKPLDFLQIDTAFADNHWEYSVSALALVSSAVEPSSKCLHLSIVGTLQEDQEITAQASFSPNNDDAKTKYSFFKVGADGSSTLVQSSTTHKYRLQKSDVGCNIKVECIPVSKTGASGAVVTTVSQTKVLAK